MIEQMSVFKPTLSNWYPSFIMDKETDLVSISFHVCHQSGLFKICAYGNGDFGYELVLKDYQDTLEIFMLLLSLDVVNRTDVINHNFQSI